MNSPHARPIRRRLALLLSAVLSLTLVGALPSQAEPARGETLSVEITHSNPADGYKVGDRLSFTYTVESHLTEARGFSLLESNLTDDAGCKWQSFPAGSTADCAFGYHDVTEDDLAAGEFVPTATWGVYDSTGYAGTVAERLEVTGEPVVLEEALLTVEAEHTNPQTYYAVGDRIELTYDVTNVSGNRVGVVPAGELADFDPTTSQATNCRYRELPAGESYICTSAYHVVTEADLEAGTFTPETSWAVHAGSYQGELLRTIAVDGPTVVLPTEADQAEGREDLADYDAVRGGEPFYTEVQLATNGQGGFPNYRIPALTVANNGDILASYDGRPTGADSPGPNSILQRRSTDNGGTWEEQTIIRAGKTTQPIEGYSDPSYIVDRETGHIFNFHVFSMDQGFWGSQPGTDPDDRNVIHANVSTSTDNGYTWTHRTITEDITNDASWNSRFATSGQGIQLKYGDHAGRLIQQYPVRVGNVTQAVSVYSDDNGETWQAGEPVGTAMDENKTVELSDGRVMLNTRDQAGGGYRRVAISEDGGHSYGEVVVDRELPDPTNNASIIRAFPNAPQGSADAKVLLFSNSATTSGRTNGTIRMSCDDGETWPVSRVFQPGGMAYSTLATLPDGSIGLLYEPDAGNGGIRFAKFNLAWLGEECVGVSAADVTTDAGESLEVPVTVTNLGQNDITGGEIELGLPEGWTATRTTVPDVPVGESATATVQVTVPEDARPGLHRIEISLVSDQGRSGGSFSIRVNAAEGQFLSVTGTHRDPKPVDEYEVGDRLSFTFDVHNVSGQQIAVIPDGDLQGFDPDDGAPNCRYMALAAEGSYSCVTAYHVVTQADLDAGEFTPETSWEARVGGVNGDSLGVLELEEPTVRLTSQVDPTPTPTEEPTSEEPTEEPSEEPTTEEPSEEPTSEEPTEEPSEEPTSEEPTEEPSEEPTTEEPSEQPTSEEPTEEPTSEEPTEEPTSEEPTEEPTTEEPTEGIELGAGEVVAGGEITVSAWGFQPGEDVVITLADAVLATVAADEAGAVLTTVVVPAGLAPGEYEVVATGQESGLSVVSPMTVLDEAQTPAEPTNPATTAPGTAPGGGELPSTGAPVALGGLAAAVLLALGGLLVQRRRQHA